jgi:hypothetical protein
MNCLETYLTRKMKNCRINMGFVAVDDWMCSMIAFISILCVLLLGLAAAMIGFLSIYPSHNTWLMAEAFLCVVIVCAFCTFFGWILWRPAKYGSKDDLQPLVEDETFQLRYE